MLNSERLREIRAEVAGEYLYDFYYYSVVLGLMRSHFPDKLGYNDGLDVQGWVWLFEQFCSLVDDADWFEVDWDLVNNNFDPWMQTNEFDFKRQFAVSLFHIPVRCYGLWGMEDVWFEGKNFDGDDYAHCGVDVLMFLISDCNISAEDVLDYEIEYKGMFGVLENYKRSAVYNRLVRADFSKYKPPLRWLPELAPVFVGKAGNVLLDTPQVSVNYEFHPFMWGADLERIRAAWVEAKPIVGKLKAFLKWIGEVESDYFEERLQSVVDAVVDSFWLNDGGVF